MIINTTQEKALQEIVRAFYPCYTQKEVEELPLNILIEYAELAIMEIR